MLVGSSEAIRSMRPVYIIKRYSGVNRTARSVAHDAGIGVTSMLDQGCSLSSSGEEGN